MERVEALEPEAERSVLVSSHQAPIAFKPTLTPMGTQSRPIY